jgi:hypothetical protein
MPSSLPIESVLRRLPFPLPFNFVMSALKIHRHSPTPLLDRQPPRPFTPIKESHTPLVVTTTHPAVIFTPPCPMCCAVELLSSLPNFFIAGPTQSLLHLVLLMVRTPLAPPPFPSAMVSSRSTRQPRAQRRRGAPPVSGHDAPWTESRVVHCLVDLVHEFLLSRIIHMFS